MAAQRDEDRSRNPQDGIEQALVSQALPLSFIIQVIWEPEEDETKNDVLVTPILLSKGAERAPGSEEQA